MGRTRVEWFSKAFEGAAKGRNCIETGPSMDQTESKRPAQTSQDRAVPGRPAVAVEPNTPHGSTTVGPGPLWTAGPHSTRDRARQREPTAAHWILSAPVPACGCAAQLATPTEFPSVHRRAISVSRRSRHLSASLCDGTRSGPSDDSTRRSSALPSPNLCCTDSVTRVGRPLVPFPTQGEDETRAGKTSRWTTNRDISPVGSGRHGKPRERPDRTGVHSSLGPRQPGLHRPSSALPQAAGILVRSGRCRGLRQ